jgi:hypothetical protein
MISEPQRAHYVNTCAFDTSSMPRLHIKTARGALKRGKKVRSHAKKLWDSAIKTGKSLKVSEKFNKFKRPHFLRNINI